MKGLLHRLAARAAGTATVVRSDARLPYGTDALAWSPAVEDPLVQAPEAAVSSAVPVRVAERPMRVSVAPSERDAQDAYASDRSHEGVIPLPEVHEPRPLSPPRASSPDVSTRVLELATTPELDAGVSRINVPQRALVSAASEENEREPVAMPAEPPSRIAPQSARLARNAAPASPRTSLERAASADPAPLLSPLPNVARAAGGEPPFSTAAQQPLALPLGRSAVPSAASYDEANEVHIHIGRIEVTAVHEAPKARIKPSAKSPAVSLDAFLDARSRR
jgi:hypothetical protein